MKAKKEVPRIAGAPAAPTRYSIAVCKGAALLHETEALLREWKPGEATEEFVARVLRHDALGRTTAYRARDIVRRVFVRRFLEPTDMPARWLKGVLTTRLPRKAFAELVFLFAARKDLLLRDFTVERYWGAVRRGQPHLTNDDVASLVYEGAEHGKLPKPWSAPVRVKVARGILGTLRDVGFLRDGLRGRREVIHYHLSEQGTACIARILHEEGLRHSGLSEHADWKLFGLGAAEVAEKLDELGEARGLLVQRAGSVVSLTWRVESMEELLHALAR